MCIYGSGQPYTNQIVCSILQMQKPTSPSLHYAQIAPVHLLPKMSLICPLHGPRKRRCTPSSVPAQHAAEEEKENSGA